MRSLLLFALLAGCSPQASTDRSPYRSYVETIEGSNVQFEMVWIPEGGFWIGKTEVTWDEYLLYCDFAETGSIPPGVDAVSKPSEPLPDVAPFDRDWGTGKRPAVGMSKNAAQKYCEWLSLNTGHRYRLPTEVEWLIACGEQPQEPRADYAWHEGNSDFMTQEVAQKQPNQHGLYDMLGNLWEYCRDPYDPSEPDRAVLRGGSWNEPAAEITRDSRLGFDDAWTLDDPNVPSGVWWVPDGGHLGLRVLRVPPDQGDSR